MFVRDLAAECCGQQVASEARSTALKVRFMVGDREFTKCFLCQIHHLPPLFLHNACSGPEADRFVLMQLFVSQEGYFYVS